MAADYGASIMAPGRDLEPRMVAGRCQFRRARKGRFHDAVIRAGAEPGQGLGDSGNTDGTSQARIPLQVSARVQGSKERITAFAAQRRRGFIRQLSGFLDGPLREQSRMDEHIFSLVMEQRALLQPDHEIIAIRCLKDLGKGVLRTETGRPGCNGQEKQIVITQYSHSGLTEALDITQDFQRIRSSIDQVADEPEAISRWDEADEVGQGPQRMVTTLEVADGIGGHGAQGTLQDGRRQGISGRCVRGVPFRSPGRWTDAQGPAPAQERAPSPDGLLVPVFPTWRNRPQLRGLPGRCRARMSCQAL